MISSRLFRVFGVACLGALSVPCLAQGVLASWAKHFDDPSPDGAVKMVKAPDGSFFACGNSRGSALLAHYNSQGQAVWIRSFPGKATDLAVNSSSVVMVGALLRGASQVDAGYVPTGELLVSRFDYSGNRAYFRATVLPNGLDAIGARVALDSANSVVAVTNRGETARIVRYDSAGNVTFSGSYGTAGQSSVRDVSLDASGYEIAGSNAGDAFVTRFSLANAVQWTVSWPGTVDPTDQAQALLRDGSGNTYVAIADAEALGAPARLVKLSTAGAILWTASLTGFDSVSSMFLAADGTIAVAGYDEYNSGSLCLARVSAAGALLWSKTNATYRNGGAGAQNLVVDGSNNLYVNVATTLSGRNTEAVVKYDLSGNLVWVKTVSGTLTPPSLGDAPRSIALGVSGGPAVFGTAENTNTFSDLSFASFDAAGTLLSRQDSDAHAISHRARVSMVDPNGTVTLAGDLGASRTGKGFLNGVVSFEGGIGYTLGLSNTLDATPFGIGRTWDTGGTVPSGEIVGYTWRDPATQILATKVVRRNGPANWDSPAFGHQIGQAMVVDSAGGSCVATSGENGAAGQLIRLTSSGTVAWSTNIPNLSGIKLAMDSSGNFYLSHSAGLQKYSSAGAFQWEVSVALCQGVVIDNANNPCVFGGGSASTPAYLTQFSPLGVQGWSASLLAPGALGASVANAVRDASGNLIVVGTSFGVNNLDLATFKVGPNGALLWSRTLDRTARDQGVSVAVDGLGNIVSAGFSTDPVTSQDYLAVRYTPAGDPGYAAPGYFTYDSGWQADDVPADVRMDAYGKAYLSGTSVESSGASAFRTVKVDSPTPDMAVYVKQTVPSSMTAGQSYNVVFDLQNTGTSTWTKAGGFRLRCLESWWGKAFVELGATDSIAPGQTKHFSFTVIAPASGGGQWAMAWVMEHKGVWFGDPSNVFFPTVTVRQHAAQYVSQTVPASVKAGATFTVSVRMRNVGTLAWTQARAISLAATDPDMDTKWQTVTVPMGAADNVLQGQDKVFTFSCKAPTTPGSYTIRWRMRRDATAFTGFFGDKTTVKTISVAP